MIIHTRRLRTVIVASSIAVAAGLGVASTAKAQRIEWGGGCTTDLWASTSADKAFHEKVSPDTCGVSVRHLYDPPWSNNNYWTPWYSNASYAQTQAVAQLIDRAGGVYNN